MKIFAETKRLILREVLDSDLEGFYELDADPEVHRYLGNKPIESLKEAQQAIDFIRKQYTERGVGRFALVEKSSGDFIGWSGLKFNTGEKEAIGKKNDFYDVGYRLIPRYWNKGYATESSLAALNLGFNDLQLQTIVGAAETGNIASNKVLKKIGLLFMEEFQYEDVLINWYELKNEDYAKTMS